jgi:hypothetical protein
VMTRISLPNHHFAFSWSSPSSGILREDVGQHLLCWVEVDKANNESAGGSFELASNMFCAKANSWCLLTLGCDLVPDCA